MFIALFSNIQGVLWFMWSQRVGHDWATELYWTEAWKEYKCPLRGKWLSKLFSIHMVEYHSAIRDDKLLMHAIPCLSLKHIIGAK